MGKQWKKKCYQEKSEESNRVLHVFITQETCTKQIVKSWNLLLPLPFTTFDPQYQSRLLIFHLQVNSTAIVWHLSLSFWILLISIAFYTLLKTFLICTCRQESFDPFKKIEESFRTGQFILNSVLNHCRSFVAHPNFFERVANGRFPGVHLRQNKLQRVWSLIIVVLLLIIQYIPTFPPILLILWLKWSECKLV